MIERAWVLRGLRRALPLLVWAGCATAHDVDAISPGLSDRDAGEGEGSAGQSGRSAPGGGSGQSGSSAAGGRAGGSAGSGGMASGGRGGSGAGTAGRGGNPGSSGGNVAACSPCSDAMGSMGNLTACCTQDNQCGVDIGPLVGGGSQCVRQNAPGTDSMSCPGFTFQGNFMLTSCCGGDGLCGVFIRMTAPLGCIDPALLGDLVSPAGGGGRMGGGMGFFGGQNMGSTGGRQRCSM